MEIDETKRILDYVIEQGQVFDGINVDIEQSVIDKTMRYYRALSAMIMNAILGDISTTYKYQSLITRLEEYTNNFRNDLYKWMIDKLVEHVRRGYSDMYDMIEVGFEVQDRIEGEQVQEMQNMIDESSIEFIRQHAFQQVTNISNTIANNLKSQLSMLLVQKKTTTKDVSEVVKNVMNTNKSRAEMIAQTEMNMAYNAGLIARLSDHNRMSREKLQKYWHGFKYSKITCKYCRPRIGKIYNIDDNTEVLPAHPRCRCLWLPYNDHWGKPISTMFTRNKNMIDRVYSPEQIYSRINKRLNISYAEYIPIDDAKAYLRGSRGAEIKKKFDNAKEIAINTTIDSFDGLSSESSVQMAHEFNQQMKFWKDLVAKSIVDKDKKMLDKSYEAIKGVMILPWDATQITKWNKLLRIIKKNM